VQIVRAWCGAVQMAKFVQGKFFVEGRASRANASAPPASVACLEEQAHDRHFAAPAKTTPCNSARKIRERIDGQLPTQSSYAPSEARM
jgi:hypothetical protein